MSKTNKVNDLDTIGKERERMGRILQKADHIPDEYPREIASLLSIYPEESQVKFRLEIEIIPDAFFSGHSKHDLFEEIDVFMEEMEEQYKCNIFIEFQEIGRAHV